MKTILFIEDEQHLQKILGLRLGKEGFKVLNALNGEAGLKLAKEKKPDLILLDIIMPLKDGSEVFETLKKDPETKDIPVMILTNLDTERDVQKMLELGATTYLIKADYSLSDLVTKIKEACS